MRDGERKKGEAAALWKWAEKEKQGGADGVILGCCTANRSG